jgi:hypothetical protein
VEPSTELIRPGSIVSGSEAMQAFTTNGSSAKAEAVKTIENTMQSAMSIANVFFMFFLLFG